MLEFLYYLCIYPLEHCMNFALQAVYASSHSAPLAILLLSLLVNIALLPLYHIAEQWQESERKIQAQMAPKLREFKEVFSGKARHMIVNTLYRQHNYSQWMALRTSAGLLLQIPFFFAAYHLLNNNPLLIGQSFGPIQDLSKADALIQIAQGTSINLLPFLMTLTNIAAVRIYARSLSLREKLQLYILAFVFFIALYTADAALLLYWICNNLFSLAKNYVYQGLAAQQQKKNSKLFSGAQSYIKHVIHAINQKIVNTLSLQAALFAFALSALFFTSAIIAMKKLGTTAASISLMAVSCALSLLCFWIRAIHFVSAETNKSIVPTKREHAKDQGTEQGKERRASEKSVSDKSARQDLTQEVASKAIEKTSSAARLAKAVLWFVFFSGLASAFICGGLSSYRKLQSLPSWTYYRLFALAIGLLWASFCSQRRILQQILRLNKAVSSRLSVERAQGLAGSASLLWASLLFFYLPFSLYVSDVNFFYEPLVRILASCSFFFFVFLAICHLLFSLAPKEIKAFFSLFFCLLSLSALFFLFIARADYGVMDGFILQDVQALKTRWAIFIDIAIFSLSLVCLCLVYRHALWKPLQNVSIGLACLFIGISFVQLYLAPQQLVLANTQASARLPEYNDRLLSFSQQEKNVLVIMFDMFTGGHMQKLLTENPEFIQQYDGFTWYPDTVAPGATTLISISALLGGENYTAYAINNRSPKDLQEAIQEGFTVLPNQLAPKNYDLAFADVEELVPQKLELACPVTKDAFFVGPSFMTAYTGYWRDKHNRPSPLPESQVPFLLSFSLFQTAPWVSRQHIYHNGAWLGTQSLVANPAEGPLAFVELLPEVSQVKESQATFKFITSQLTHYPWRIDPKSCLPDGPGGATWKDGIIVQHYDAEYCALKLFTHFIDWLKEKDIYDNTLIILVSDHDGNDSPQIAEEFNHLRTSKVPFKPHALLLVKGFGQRGDLQEDEALMSSADIAALICSETQDCEEGLFQDPRKIKNRVRTHSSGLASIRRHEKDRFNVTTFSINGTMFAPENWEKISN